MTPLAEDLLYNLGRPLGLTMTCMMLGSIMFASIAMHPHQKGKLKSRVKHSSRLPHDSLEQKYS
ncbi:hypothetical protein GF325_07625 [Candidatus Bathyarchaeota archaeon]|nr:hypothetical protein [Candidatus Bathyarchaeota archaeon]